MKKQYYADTVDENGEVYEAVGENIRKGAKDPDSITGSFVETSDKVDFIDNLQLDAEHLKSLIVQALEGLGFTPEELQTIKSYMGITTPESE